MKKIISTLTLAAVISACSNQAPVVSNTQEKSKINNIIMVVADGMGPAYTSAYRYYADDGTGTNIEDTVFDRHLVGSSSTYPARISGFVTDSAASATALASGVKTYNQAIGLDADKRRVESVLQRAKKLGKKTGVVVTSQINHATPASYITHNESRRNYNEIANSYIDNGINTDVLLGGGTHYYIREDRNLVEEYQAAGYHYIDNYQSLNSLPKNQPVLGLFAPVGLVGVLDDSDPYRLTTMSKAAIKQLENDQGFFLLIEASQVDWAGHGNDISSAMAEMRDLASTLNYLETYVTANPDTQVIITADHSTGGFTIAANGVYEWRPAMIKKMTASTYSIAKHFEDKEITKQALSKRLADENLTEQQVDKISQAKIQALNNLATYNAMTEIEQKKQRKPSVHWALHTAIKALVDDITNTGWTSSGHTAIDVPVFAIGTESHRFNGFQDNTDIAKTIFTLLEE